MIARGLAIPRFNASRIIFPRATANQYTVERAPQHRFKKFTLLSLK